MPHRAYVNTNICSHPSVGGVSKLKAAYHFVILSTAKNLNTFLCIYRLTLANSPVIGGEQQFIQDDRLYDNAIGVLIHYRK